MYRRDNLYAVRLGILTVMALLLVPHIILAGAFLDTISVQPVHPTDEDLVSVTVQFTTCDCAEYYDEYFWWWQDDNELCLTVKIYECTDCLCTTICTDHEVTGTSTAPLPAGDYQVIVYAEIWCYEYGSDPQFCEVQVLGTENFTVSPSNHLPQAGDDLVDTDEETPIVIEVLANDSDPDGDPLTVESVSEPVHGEAEINPDGTITYTPEEDYCGVDSFFYTVSDGHGGTDTAMVKVTVRCANDPPIADFIFDPPGPIVQQVVYFDATGSYDPDGEITKYEWHFEDDGSTAEGVEVTHVFKEYGEFSVTLEVWDDRGESASVTKSVRVNAPPVAQFDFSPEEPTVGEEVWFDPRLSKDLDGEIVWYGWDWESDGKVDVSITRVRRGGATKFAWDLQNDGRIDKYTDRLEPYSHTFASPGTHKVTLCVKDTAGVKDCRTKVIHILMSHSNQPPVAAFTWYVFSPEGERRIGVEPRVGDVVRFDASESHDPDGRIVEYVWDFDGDGKPDETAVEPVTEHRYGEPGNYTVTLCVTDDWGATGEVSQDVEIGEPLSFPKAAFTFLPAKPTAKDTVEFIDRSHDPDGKIVSWHWDFGDGTISTERNPRHRYTRKGSFTVKLTVTDDDGLTDTVEKEIEVVNVPPKAFFTFGPEEPYAGQEVSFDASGSGDPDGEIVEYAWDFDGDGVTDAEGVRVTHAYEKPGTYTVKLTVTDENGAKATGEREIVVKEREEVFVPKEVWGLIIGISDYEAEGLDLDCARADAEAMYEWLMGTGVPKDHMRLLVDKEATLVNVRQGLDWLMKNAGEDDLVIFYFSGHGYQGMDIKPKEETDGWDEYFVVHDTDRDSIEGTALRDDEFGGFLDEIASKHVLVIFDSCYSGGLPKGQRGLPPRGKPKGPLDFFNDFDPKGKLVLAASAEDQLSWEDRDLGHGVFTHFLLEGLKGKADANGDYRVTAEELYEYVYREVPKYVREKFHADQEPQLLGKGDPRVEVGIRDRPPEAAFSWEPEAPYALGEVRFRDASSDDHGVVSWSWDFGDGAASSERNPVHVYGEEGSYRVVLVVMDTAGQKARVERELQVGPPGEVTAVDPERGLVLISVGAKNGVKVGDRFEAFKLYDSLEEVHGIIEVVKVYPRRSLCRMVESPLPIEPFDLVRPVRTE